MAAYPFSFPHVLTNDVGMTYFIDSSHDDDADADDADVRGRLSTFSEGRGIPVKSDATVTPEVLPRKGDGVGGGGGTGSQWGWLKSKGQ